jgi:hypothetical protein
MGEILRKELIILLVLLGVFLSLGCADNKSETPDKETTPVTMDNRTGMMENRTGMMGNETGMMGNGTGMMDK